MPAERELPTSRPYSALSREAARPMSTSSSSQPMSLAPFSFQPLRREDRRELVFSLRSEPELASWGVRPKTAAGFGVRALEQTLDGRKHLARPPAGRDGWARVAQADMTGYQYKRAIHGLLDVGLEPRGRARGHQSAPMLRNVRRGHRRSASQPPGVSQRVARP
jgi:hypothetical protein